MWAGEHSGQGFLLSSSISGANCPRGRDLPRSAFLVISLQAFLPCITSALPRLLLSPSPRSVCVIVPEPSGGSGNNLNPHGVGRIPDSFMGRASSSAAALALYCLHKAFLLISGSHPQHSEGN